MLRDLRGKRAWLVPVLALAVVAAAGAIFIIWRTQAPDPRVVPLHNVVDAISDIHGVVIDPSEPSTLWAPTHQGLARFTPERGWEIVGEVGRDTMGLNIDGRNSSVMYAGAHPSPLEAVAGKPRVSGFLVSRDRGQSWETVSLEGQADFHILSMSRSDPKVFYMSGIFVDDEERPDLLYVSRDGGQTWKPVATGLPRILAVAVHPQDPDTVLAGTQDGLFVSRDGGKGWQPLSSNLEGMPVTAVTFGPRDAKVVWVYARDADMGLLRSEDGGQTWSSVGQCLGADDWIRYIAVHPTEPAKLFLSSEAQGIYRSGDSGKTLETMMRRGQASP